MIKKSLKAVYRRLPLKQPVFDVVRRVWTPPDWLSGRLRFEGEITVPVPSHGDLRLVHRGYSIENRLYWQGLSGWEKQSVGLWLRLAPISDRILDIGANTGVYALLAKLVSPAAVVDAFEPLEDVYAILVENASLNRMDIRCHRLALSNHDGQAQLWAKSGSTYDASLEKAFRNLSEDAATVVQVQRGDTFCDGHAEPAVDLIKVDTESHEAEVIAGMMSTIALHRPAMLIEIIRETVGERVWRLLQPLGYRCYMIDERHGFRRVERPTRTSVLPGGEVFNFLFVQRDRHLCALS